MSKSAGGWDDHAMRIVEFAVAFVIILVVAIFIIAYIVPVVPSGNGANALANVTNSFYGAVGVLSNPLFYIAFIVVIVLIAYVAVRAIRQH